MKKKKLVFDKVERFKELIELTGLVSYDVESDDGRGLIISTDCKSKHDLSSELHDFLYDFHSDYFYSAEGSAEIVLVSDEIQITWQEVSSLDLDDDIMIAFQKLLCDIYLIPDECYLDFFFSGDYAVFGSMEEELEIESYENTLVCDEVALEDWGFSEDEMEKIKQGVYFQNPSKVQSLFEKYLFELLLKHRVSNCNFSIEGDASGLRYFTASQIQEEVFVLHGTI